MMDRFLEIFNEVWQKEFYRGVLLTTGTFFAVLLVYWLLKIIFFCKFGKRRCSTVTIKREHGEIVIAANAVSAAIRSELKQFKELDIHRIVLFRKRGPYSMEIRCDLVKSTLNRGLPELHSLIEPLIKLRMEDIFGLTALEQITLKVEHSENFEEFTENEIPDSPELPDIAMK